MVFEATPIGIKLNTGCFEQMLCKFLKGDPGMEKASVHQVVELSGLPQEPAFEFLAEEFAIRGKNLELATLDDLKDLLVDMLQDLIMETDSVVERP